PSLLLSPPPPRLPCPRSFPTRRSSDLPRHAPVRGGLRSLRAGRPPRPAGEVATGRRLPACGRGRHRGRRPHAGRRRPVATSPARSEEHTSELQSLAYLVCRLLLEKKKQ